MDGRTSFTCGRAIIIGQRITGGAITGGLTKLAVLYSPPLPGAASSVARQSVCPSVRPTVILSVPCLRFTRNQKAVQTSYLVETCLWIQLSGRVVTE